MNNRDFRGLLPLLTAAMAIGPLLTYGLSSTSALVIDSLGITAVQFGMLATLTFLTAAALSLTFGRFSDRFPARALLVTVFAGAALSFVVAALSTNYLWLLAAMALSGAAQALSNPVTNRVISDHAPPAKRSPWIGVKQSGVQASQLAAGIGCPTLALTWGMARPAVGRRRHRGHLGRPGLAFRTVSCLFASVGGRARVRSTVLRPYRAPIAAPRPSGYSPPTPCSPAPPFKPPTSIFRCSRTTRWA